MSRVGQYVRFTRAHKADLSEPCWAQITRCEEDGYNGDSANGATPYRGVIVAGISGRAWRPGSPCRVYDPKEISEPWTKGSVRYEYIDEDDVPDEVWATIARTALIEGEN